MGEDVLFLNIYIYIYISRDNEISACHLNEVKRLYNSFLYDAI